MTEKILAMRNKDIMPVEEGFVFKWSDKMLKWIRSANEENKLKHFAAMRNKDVKPVQEGYYFQWCDKKQRWLRTVAEAR